ncbi:probable methyltransferase-like protein 25 isoform X3 [Halichondria panicea]|uniref:probable methyltransferase-like protein 25 isoform X3 n=1 Tax=Halichondria panicea TaxID=6063 RepID=UPI00312B2CE4
MMKMWMPSADETLKKLKQLYSFIGRYRSICEAHSVDFYLHDNWSNCLPQSWRDEIVSIDECWYVNPPSGGGPMKEGSLMDFFCEAKKLRLPLTVDDIPVPQKTVPKMASFAMSAKKSHEVKRFSQFVCDDVLKQCEHVQQVVDVGSGKGYLSEYLARCSGVTVVGLDSQPMNTRGALNRKQKVSKRWKKKAKAGVLKRSLADLSRKDISLTEDSLSISDLFNELSSTLSAPEDSSDSCLKEPFCIIGLHACGDLTSTALRMFSSLPTAAAVCVVGCCYHHITEEGGTTGFPLCNYLRSIDAHLGRNTRMLACQTLARFTETTSVEAILKIHWRAMLQVVLSRHFSELFNAVERLKTDLVVGRMKKPVKTFQEYCAIALQRLKLDVNRINPSHLTSIELEYLSRITKLQQFIRVRAVLAACIESVIILDRLLFLQEQHDIATAGLVQLFDPVTSPRCYAIVALSSHAC